MAKYKAYPEYKDSGVEWLKAIPEHWKLSKLRYQFVFGKGLTITKEHLQDEGIPCVNYGEVHSKYGFEVDPEIHTLKCVSDKYLKDNSSSLLAKGDIVFADTSEDIDGSGNFTQLVSDTVTFAGYHTIIARPFERENSRFYAYLLDCKELRSQVRHAVKGVKVFSITQAILRNLSIWLPSNDEQAKIAAFLDHETAKIDNLIEKQQQLIELIKEKRQAVISHAVTKGLNPDVPMKDSGVEWLGEVPADWIKQKLVNVSEGSRGSFVNGPFGSDLLAEELRDHGVPVVYIRDIKPTGYSRKSTVFVTPMKAKQLDVCKLEPGNVVVSKVGDPPGDACVYPVGEPSAIITQDVIRIRVNMAQFSPEFIAYLLNSDFGRMVVNDISVEGTRKRVSLGDFKSTRFVFPPLKESLDIVRYLNSECEKLSCTIAKATQAVAFMQERRTALISAAVTGKIDVRDWVAPDTQDVEEPLEATA
ncbi:TPA: restriction endonuclease subunit S [Enterobacter asburiae]|nr:restriction endonuclease subunit S [Enterobacter asburiae]